MARGRKPVAGSKRQREAFGVRLSELTFWLNAHVDVDPGHPEPIVLTSGDETRRFASPALRDPLSRVRAADLRRALEADLAHLFTALRAEAHARLAAVLHGTPFTPPIVQSVPRFSQPRLDGFIDEVVAYSKTLIESAARTGHIPDVDGVTQTALSGFIWTLRDESGGWFRSQSSERPGDVGEAVMGLLSELLFITRNTNNPELLFIDGMKAALPQVIRDAVKRATRALRHVERFRSQSRSP